MLNLIAGASLCLSPWGRFTEQVQSLREDCKLPRILQRQHLHDEKKKRETQNKLSAASQFKHCAANPQRALLNFVVWVGVIREGVDKIWSRLRPTSVLLRWNTNTETCSIWLDRAVAQRTLLVLHQGFWNESAISGFIWKVVLKLMLITAGQCTHRKACIRQLKIAWLFWVGKAFLLRGKPHFNPMV